MRNKDFIEFNFFFKSKQIPTAGNYNEWKNKKKNYFGKQWRLIRK